MIYMVVEEGWDSSRAFRGKEKQSCNVEEVDQTSTSPEDEHVF